MAGDVVKRLNIGCGLVLPDGWVNIDERAYPDWPHRHGGRRYPQADDFDEGPWLANPLGHMGASRLPWHDDTFDGAVSHHVLQMIEWPHLVPWLAEVRRVLKPSAVLRLSVPDMLGAFGAYLHDEPSWFPIDDAHEESCGGKLCMYLTQAGATRSVFTEGWLLELLERAGYHSEARLEPGETIGPDWLVDLDSRPGESMFVEALA